jgi:hypothetical protein
MDISENLRDTEQLYQIVCKALKPYGNIPNKADFYDFLKRFNELREGHKSLLTAIGKL